MDDWVLDIQVLGTPRPKGSLRFVTRSYAKEQNDTSPEWRARVANAARQAFGPDRPPHLGAVHAVIQLYFKPPKKHNGTASTRSTGDLDKHARNILDAIEDAGVIRDDAQITALHISKRYATTGPPHAVVKLLPAARQPTSDGV